MNGPELLKSHAGRLRTAVGACWPGQRAVFRGRDLHKELRHSDWLEFYLFGITGRHFTPEETKLLHGIWVITSYPDTRIWNNRVAGLAGSVRSTPILGLAAAQAITEARVYGAGPSIRAIDFFMRAACVIRSGDSLPDLLRKELASGYIYGYGRPISSRDERLPWLIELANSLKLDGGTHLELALKVEKVLTEDFGKPNLKLNYAGLAAALAADLGITPRQWHLFRFPTVLAGMPPCWIEASEKPEGSLFPTPCDGIAYGGVPERSWPQDRKQHDSSPYIQLLK